MEATRPTITMDHDAEKTIEGLSRVFSETENYNQTSHEDSHSYPRISFIHQLYNLLSENHVNVIMWSDDGSFFRILDKAAFINNVLPLHYSHDNFGSFQRQLNFYGFKRIPRTAIDLGGYIHPKFKRGRYDLLGSITRKRSNKNINTRANNPSVISAVRQDEVVQDITESPLKRPALMTSLSTNSWINTFYESSDELLRDQENDKTENVGDEIEVMTRKSRSSTCSSVSTISQLNSEVNDLQIHVDPTICFDDTLIGSSEHHQTYLQDQYLITQNPVSTTATYGYMTTGINTANSYTHPMDTHTFTSPTHDIYGNTTQMNQPAYAIPRINSNVSNMTGPYSHSNGIESTFSSPRTASTVSTTSTLSCPHSQVHPPDLSTICTQMALKYPNMSVEDLNVLVMEVTNMVCKNIQLTQCTPTPTPTQMAQVQYQSTISTMVPTLSYTYPTHTHSSQCPHMTQPPPPPEYNIPQYISH